MEAIDIEPARSRVWLRPRGILTGELLEQLEDEAHELIARGFASIGIDLERVTATGPLCGAVLAAIDRDARAHRARMSVALGAGTAGQALAAAGLLGELAVEPASETPFFDWTR